MIPAPADPAISGTRALRPDNPWQRRISGVNARCRRKRCGIRSAVCTYHGDVPTEVRLLKLTEEVGEVADAFLGVHGLNKRKGVCRTRDDLLAELADVIITAAVAMSGVTGDVDEARRHLERRLAAVTERAGL